MSAVVEAREPSAKYLSALQSPLVQHFELMATAPGGVARLRELILTLAVQGKLVPQDPKDGHAKELLKEIRAEKDRLASAGKTRRDKPLEPITEKEQPFNLPLTWKWARFGDVSINRDGERIPVSSSDRDKRAKIYDYYGASGVIDKIDGYLFDKTLLLIGEDGANLLNRSTPIAYLAHGQYWVNNHAHVIDTTHSDLMNYLALFINAISLEPYVTGTAQPKMNQAKLNSIVVALPPLTEQPRIVTRVEELMRLCDALEAKGELEAAQHAQLVQTLLSALTTSTSPEELADNWQCVATHFDLLLDRPEAIDALEQTILQLAVRGLLVPQDPEDEPASELMKKIRAEKGRLIADGKIKRDKPMSLIGEDDVPFEIPEGWVWVRWVDIAMKIGDIDHKMPSEVKEGIPYVSPRDFFGTNEIDFDGAKKISESDFLDLSSKIRPEVGDLIYPRYGTIGVVRKVTVDREFLASYSCAVIKVLHGCVEPDYQYLFSISGCAKDQATAATNKTTQPNVGIKSIQEFLYPLPPLAEQSRIVARVNLLRNLCTDLRQRLAARQITQAHLAEALIDEVA